MELSGKVVLISGGAQGLGKAYSQSFLQRGSKVVILDVDETEGEKTLAEFQEKFGKDKVRFLSADVRNDDAYKEAFMKVVKEFGNVDILINNAGILDEVDWQKCVDINICGAIRGTLLAVEHMRKDKGGTGGLVVNISSIAGFLPFSVSPTYTGTKYAVLGFTRSWAQYSKEADLGVRLATLCPGLADTSMVHYHGNTLDDMKTMEIASSYGKMTVNFVSDALIQLVSATDNNGRVMVVTKEDGVYYKEF